MTVNREDVVRALSTIVDPGSGRDLIAADMAKAINIGEGGGVSFVIEVDPGLGPQADCCPTSRPPVIPTRSLH
jgi:ATP-binding protein involved in chromosome partitioning